MGDSTKFSHINKKGEVNMVDISNKNVSLRSAVASSKIYMEEKTFKVILAGNVKKGDLFATAKIAGIMAAKKTSELIPLCHPLNLNKVEIDIISNDENYYIEIIATVITEGKTGVEIEALTAATLAALTIYDMAKAMEKSMVISEVKLLEKSGGKSGLYIG